MTYDIYTASPEETEDFGKQIAEELAGEREPIYLVGDGYAVAHRALTEAGVRLKGVPEGLITASAASVGRVAYRKFLRGEYVTDRELVPTYLRLPQAEREGLERLNNENKEKAK